jgi:hypothetical protein
MRRGAGDGLQSSYLAEAVLAAFLEKACGLYDKQELATSVTDLS